MNHYLSATSCQCGKNHDVAFDEVVIGSGAIPPDLGSGYSGRPMLCDIGVSV